MHWEALVPLSPALPMWFGTGRAFSQQDAITELKAHTWLVEVETSLFQWPCRGTVCAGLPYQLGTLIWVPSVAAAPCQALGTLGRHREAHLPLWQHCFEAHHPSPAGSCETLPPASHSHMPRQILPLFPALVTSHRASVSVIRRDSERRNRASPRHAVSPRPPLRGAGPGPSA